MLFGPKLQRMLCPISCLQMYLKNICNHAVVGLIYSSNMLQFGDLFSIHCVCRIYLKLVLSCYLIEIYNIKIVFLIEAFVLICF
jgi:hypothetical protein